MEFCSKMERRERLRPSSRSRSRRGRMEWSDWRESGKETSERRDQLMHTTPSIYCAICYTLRGIHDWHERRDSLAIELEPCGHVTVRDSRIEWMARPRAA